MRTALALDGVDLVIHRTDHPDGEAIVRSARGELRFRPGGDLTDLRGERWSVEGDLAALELDDRRTTVVQLGRRTRTRSAASGRRCAAGSPAQCCCRPQPGYEFTDWGGSVHLGGGSHGSLHANDSHGVLLWAGGDLPGGGREAAVGAARRDPDDPRPLRRSTA